MSAREPATLFYDARCPACRMFARLVLAADTERRLRTAPLDSPAADRSLGDLPDEQRYGSYHLVVGNRRTGAGRGVGPLLEQVRLTRPLGRLIRRSPAAGRAATALYDLVARHRGALARVAPRVDLPR
jgi:predicted DCC family thiol-disulfide oxidoreductase YuxK